MGRAGRVVDTHPLRLVVEQINTYPQKLEGERNEIRLIGRERIEVAHPRPGRPGNEKGQRVNAAR